jgi:hypothetical protein
MLVRAVKLAGGRYIGIERIITCISYTDMLAKAVPKAEDGNALLKFYKFVKDFWINRDIYRRSNIRLDRMLSYVEFRAKEQGVRPSIIKITFNPKPINPILNDANVDVCIEAAHLYGFEMYVMSENIYKFDETELTPEVINYVYTEIVLYMDYASKTAPKVLAAIEKRAKELGLSLK